MENDFYEGQIFEKEYPSEAADWCNEGQIMHIEEIESKISDNGEQIRMFKIVPNVIPEEIPDEFINPLDEIDEAICSLYEMILEMQNGQS